MKILKEIITVRTMMIKNFGQSNVYLGMHLSFLNFMFGLSN